MTTHDDNLAPVLPQAQAQTNNESIEAYLRYYIDFSNPGYATLITGDWGAGKSYLIKKAIPEKARFYVSLFGLTSTQEVYASVFSAMYPTKAKIKKAIGSLEGAGLSTPFGGLELGAMLSGLASAFMKDKVDHSRVLIFDDLERCQINTNDLLGVINNYVEHHGCRVIVIAHDERLKAGFASSKEKLFGQTLTVAADFLSAYDHFTQHNHIQPELLALFRQHREAILNTVIQSGLQSLRVLKHILGDLSRIYNSLTDSQRNNSEAIENLSKLYTAYAIPTRLGELSAEDIRTRANARTNYFLRFHLKQVDDTVKPALVSIASRHPNIDLSDTVLSDSLLEDMLFSGIFSAPDIQKWLIKSRYYAAPEEMQSWRAFMEIDSYDHETAQKVIENLNEDFLSGSIKNRSEILHLFGIQLMLSERKINGDSVEETTQRCRDYLDRLMKAGELAPAPKHLYRNDRSHRSYGGYAYWVTDDCKADFIELESYLEDCEEKTLRASYPATADHLLSLLSSDSNQFVELLSREGYKGTSYSYVPVLQSIKPEDFVNCFAELPPHLWRPVSSTLSERYSAGQLHRELREELEWVESIMSEFANLQAASPPLLSFRLDRNIPWALNELANDVRNHGQT
jgi:hypothetical protein